MIRTLWRFAILLVAAACGLVQAQEYPNKPVKVFVPFPAGGSADILARLIAQGLGDKLGQQFVVENRAGAAGNLGTDAVAKAAPAIANRAITP